MAVTRATRTPGEITRRERFAFAAGDVFAGGGSSLIAVVYLVFLTDVVGLDPALAGTAILVAKTWDSINDPLTGALSDRTRTRWGRRRPWIFVGALLLVGGMALLWNPAPPVHGQVWTMAWAMGSYIVYNTIQTTMAVPYASFSSEISTDPAQRDKVNTLRLLFSTLSSATVTLLATRLLEAYARHELDDAGLYARIVLGFGVCFALPMLGVALFCRERVPLGDPEPLAFFRGFAKPLAIRPMRFLMGMYLCQAIAWDIVSAMVLYYAANVVAGVKSFPLLALFIVVNIIAFPVLTTLVARVSKHRLYAAGIPLALVAIAVVAFYPADGPPVGVYVAGFALAVGMAGAQLLPWVMFPDVLDAAELETGRRDSGSFGGLMTFTRGIGTALTLQAIGLVLKFTGYQSTLRGGGEQPGSAVWGIRLIMFCGVFALLALGWLVARRYPLTLDAVRAMKPRLERQRAAEQAHVPGEVG